MGTFPLLPMLVSMLGDEVEVLRRGKLPSSDLCSTPQQPAANPSQTYQSPCRVDSYVGISP